MVKFKQVKSEAEAKPFKNRKVCDVTEARHMSEFGTFINWRGSTETEYFSIIFLNGVVTVSLSEREMCVGWAPFNLGMSQALADRLTKSFRLNTFEQSAASAKYLVEEYPKEMAEINFTDIMVALDWRFTDDAKIDYNPFTP